MASPKRASKRFHINACVTSNGNGPALAGGYRLGKSLSAFDRSGEVAKWMLLGEEAIGGNTTDDGYIAPINSIGQRHNDTTNVLFLDGHVKAYREDRIRGDGFLIGGIGPSLISSYTCP